jgi:hypothetical protein
MKRFSLKLMEIIFTINLIFLVLFQLPAQNILKADCIWHWSPDKVNNPISTTILPNTTNSANAGVVNLSIEFWDLDSKQISAGTVCNATGSQGPYKAEVVGLTSYDFSINITSKNASLSSNNGMVYSLKQTYTYNDFFVKIYDDDVVSGNGYYNRYRKNFTIYLNPNWSVAKNDILIEYKIQDNSQRPPNDSGYPWDDDMKVGLIKIKYSNQICPIKMISLPSNPADGNFHNISGNQLLNFDYAVGTDLGNDKIPDYTNLTINEELSDPLVNGIFSMQDINSSFLNLYPAIITPQDFLDKFVKPYGSSNYSWTIINALPTHQDKFHTYDSHSQIIPKVRLKFIDAFTDDALNNGRAGYQVLQNFKCGNNIIGTADIVRIIDNISSNNVTKIRKNHQF